MRSQQQPPGATTISAISEDLLREILLRLPSLTSLIRAALTCRAFFSAVRWSPVFRRRFCEHHPPQLIGFFLDINSTNVPFFRPLRLGSDPDLAAAIRGADFFLTRLPDDPNSVDLPWDIGDCHDGYILLKSNYPSKMAVYNPFTGAMDIFPGPIFPQPPVDMILDLHVLSSEEDPRSFRVMCIFLIGTSVQAAVWSSDRREWQDACSHSVMQSDYCEGTQVNGLIYWTKQSTFNAPVFSIAKLQFSQIDLPLRTEGQGPLSPGKAKDGKLCMVCTDDQLSLVVWFRRVDDDGVERWMLDKTFPLFHEIDVINDGTPAGLALEILRIVDGFVYLFLHYISYNPDFGWLLSLSLETGKLINLCPTIYPRRSCLYIMAWPPSLVFNKVVSLSS